jgi:hypothetical protein
VASDRTVEHAASEDWLIAEEIAGLIDLPAPLVIALAHEETAARGGPVDEVLRELYARSVASPQR